LLPGRLSCLRLTRCSHCNRKQCCACGWGIHQLTALESTPPLEHLVRVQLMSPRHQRYTCAWLQRQIYNLLLLCDRPKSTNATPCTRSLLHDHIVRLKPAETPEGKTTRLRVTDYGRKAKWYALTRAGREQLATREKNWAQVVKGVDAMLRFA